MQFYRFSPTRKIVFFRKKAPHFYVNEVTLKTDKQSTFPKNHGIRNKNIKEVLFFFS